MHQACFALYYPDECCGTACHARAQMGTFLDSGPAYAVLCMGSGNGTVATSVWCLFCVVRLRVWVIALCVQCLPHVMCALARVRIVCPHRVCNVVCMHPVVGHDVVAMCVPLPYRVWCHSVYRGCVPIVCHACVQWCVHALGPRPGYWCRHVCAM